MNNNKKQGFSLRYPLTTIIKTLNIKNPNLTRGDDLIKWYYSKSLSR